MATCRQISISSLKSWFAYWAALGLYITIWRKTKVMKKLYILVIIAILFSNMVRAEYSLFDTSYLHEVRISSTDLNFWQQLDDDYAAWLNEEIVDIPYLRATVEIDGTSMDDVGVRQKGFSSNFLFLSTKKPLKLNFGKFSIDGEREFDGVRKLNLMNGMGDPAIVKDKLAYDMFRMHGIAGPRVAHAKIYINDTFWGIYALIEQIDKRYLKRNFANNDGNLWKNKGNSNLAWEGNDSASYPFELQTNETKNDWSKFLGFIDFINNASDTDFASQLADIFVLDEYLRILAIDILINNWDSYLNHGRNWYLYHEPKKDKIHWVPWDYNFAFNRDPLGHGDLALVRDMVLPDKVLVRRIFEVPEFKERIFDYMCEILAVNFTSDRINPILDSQLVLVINDWGSSNDLLTVGTLNDFIDGVTWFGTSGTVFQSMKHFVADRTNAMVNELISEGHTCTPLPASINPQDVVINEFMASNGSDSPWSDQDGDFDDWIELYNNTASPISLENYFLSNTDTFLHKWELPADTVIPANGYLIIWADKDPHQVGLHAKFSLSKNGGNIYLSYLDNTVIDAVSFAVQETNTSLSRVPNGTGDFITAQVTFNAGNTTNDLIFVSGFDE